MKLTKRQAHLVELFGVHTCPCCNIDLDNGVSDYEAQEEVARTNNEPGARISHQFVCLACMEEFGEEVHTNSGKEYLLVEICKKIDMTTPKARRQLRKIFGAQHRLYSFSKTEADKVIAAKSFEALK